MAYLAQQERGIVYAFATEGAADLYVSGEVAKALAGGAKTAPIWCVWAVGDDDEDAAETAVEAICGDNSPEAGGTTDVKVQGCQKGGNA